MFKRILGAAFAASLLSGTAAFATPTTYDGITFPDGDISFADAVISYIPGSPAATNPNFLNPAAALGAPNYVDTSTPVDGAVSLGNGGSIILQFTDNLLTGSDDAVADLHIFEVGPLVEGMDVAISSDGVNFISIGSVGGATSSIDIDAFGFTSSDTFGFVRLADDSIDGTGEFAGADIDAVGAISTVAATPIPLPAGGMLLLSGLGLAYAMRRRG